MKVKNELINLKHHIVQCEFSGNRRFAQLSSAQLSYVHSVRSRILYIEQCTRRKLCKYSMYKLFTKSTSMGLFELQKVSIAVQHHDQLFWNHTKI